MQRARDVGVGGEIQQAGADRVIERPHAADQAPLLEAAIALQAVAAIVLRIAAVRHVKRVRIGEEEGFRAEVDLDLAAAGVRPLPLASLTLYLPERGGAVAVQLGRAIAIVVELVGSVPSVPMKIAGVVAAALGIDRDVELAVRAETQHARILRGGLAGRVQAGDRGRAARALFRLEHARGIVAGDALARNVEAGAVLRRDAARIVAVEDIEQAGEVSTEPSAPTTATTRDTGV